MATVHQVRVAWAGLRGLPGVTTLNFLSSSAPPLAAIKAMFTSAVGKFPTGLTWTVPSAGLDIDVATGQPVGAWTATGGGVVTANGVGNYSAPSGAVINWHTGVFAGGREVRAKTFLVPLIVNQYDSDGSIGPTVISDWAGYITTFLAAAPTFVAYSRKNALTATVGSGALADKAVVLRSRRD